MQFNTIYLNTLIYIVFYVCNIYIYIYIVYICTCVVELKLYARKSLQNLSQNYIIIGRHDRVCLEISVKRDDTLRSLTEGP